MCICSMISEWHCPGEKYQEIIENIQIMVMANVGRYTGDVNTETLKAF